LFSLGFDTLIINPSAQTELSQLFDIFYPLGIKNFIFIRDVDLINDNLTFTFESLKDLKNQISSVSPRGAKIKTACCTSFAQGLSQNPDLKKLSVSRNACATLVSLPMFPSFSDTAFATELNKLLYRSKIFPIFNLFERSIKTSSSDFYSKLLSVSRVAFAIDINFLTDPQNSPILVDILSSHAHVIPCISSDVANYVSAGKNFQELLNSLGKSNYYRLCSQINKASSLLGV
jgi:hypothetical protein